LLHKTELPEIGQQNKREINGNAKKCWKLLVLAKSRWPNGEEETEKFFTYFGKREEALGEK